ncbi:MAG: DUF2914 domain-containing protein [Patescibacteria group bacterium]
MTFREMFQQVKHHWLTVAFILGFITDYLLLNRIDDTFDNALLFFYVVLASISIVLLYGSIAQKFGERPSAFFRKVAPMLMQYSFGGLFSGMLIFYSRSGALWASWPFLLLFIAAIYGNETMRNRGQQLVFNILSYFVGLFSYLVMVVPVFLGRMGPEIFVASGLLALVIVYALVQLLTKIIPNYMSMQTKPIVYMVFGLFVGLNTLYFTNVIPPIPLSLQEIHIVHEVTRLNDSTYELTYEPVEWYRYDKKMSMVFHPSESGTVACFTRVFAPAKIDTEVFHVWEYRDAEGNWVEHYRKSYAVTGKAVNGYRGWTALSSARNGVWRCSVETARGQVLGQKEFTIDTSIPPSTLEKKVD